MAPITINGNTLDPVKHASVLRALGLEAVDASESDYVLIQCDARLSPEEKAQLADLGLVLHGYVSENTYLYGYKESDLDKIRSLPFVQWAGIYLKQFKISPDLKTAARETPSQILPGLAGPPYSRARNAVDIVFHEGVDPTSDQLRRDIAAAARVDAKTIEISRNKVRLTVEDRCLDPLASIDAIRVIQKVYPLQLHNNVARSILNADVMVNGTPYRGEGEIVAVADTGFDNGSTSATHPAFTGRVVKLYDLGRPGKADDPDGHGTHVCGSVLGDGTLASGGGTIQGTAPGARLVVQSLLGPSGDLSGIPSDLHQLFGPPYQNEKARVHTNSFGVDLGWLGSQRPYDNRSNDIDDFVWNNPDMVICFSAGNDGRDGNSDGIVDLGQVSSYAAAKNCITVGASESLRPKVEPRIATYGDLNPFEFRVAPLDGDLMADNPEGMAAFSSRGPTAEGRFKPDVVAPGTSILSAHSRSAPPSNRDFGTSPDPDWLFDSGTSMATPLVAGCAAVLRETLVKNGVAEPSAALVKALIINGAVGLSGQYRPPEVGQSPNNNDGFGRVNLANSVIVPSGGGDDPGGFGQGGPLDQGGKDVIEITLVWPDPPEINGMLQNDLDLIVIAADGSERHGNMGTAVGFDTVNNVEQVFWTNMPIGKAQIVIRATHITKFPQPYAYAWRISW
ncbi:peptidase S8/S53 domain-containing protein [Echria macrotheca]|uniref:Peptidase S8/S53 domain-containing protein n=1 Tax=Echria macrotheca TaxID=438768 RepID=A0AAJ0BF43_9PEZI|nr:peptidase S8/S53 domain-containing protein [Echria macrotheca]